MVVAKPDHAGLRSWRRARRTGTHVGVYNGAEAGLDTENGEYPWSTICDEHGGIVSHRTRELAEHHASVPEEWCPVCQRYLIQQQSRITECDHANGPYGCKAKRARWQRSWYHEVPAWHAWDTKLDDYAAGTGPSQFDSKEAAFAWLAKMEEVG